MKLDSQEGGIVHTDAALLVAHPGHELRVYGWIEKVRPRVFVLTDGSGHSGKGRLPSTASLLESLGCERGAIFGRFSDIEVYAAMLQKNFEFFLNIREELCSSLLAHKIKIVVGDAMEGYNTIHDVWRLLINSAVDRANRQSGFSMANYDFAVVGNPDLLSQGDVPGMIRLEIGNATLERKLAVAQEYTELAGEVEAAFGEFGVAAFGVESLRPVSPIPDDAFHATKPFYETYGEKQVAAGFYKEVIRYREHLLPLAEALSTY
jgi:hypothetical protein